jgi:hypothetical protein
MAATLPVNAVHKNTRVLRVRVEVSVCHIVGVGDTPQAEPIGYRGQKPSPQCQSRGIVNAGHIWPLAAGRFSPLHGVPISVTVLVSSCELEEAELPRPT